MAILNRSWYGLHKAINYNDYSISNEDLKYYWTFNNTLNDEMKLMNLYGENINYDIGKFNNGLNFNNDNSYVRINNNYEVELKENIIFYFWIKRNSIDVDKHIIISKFNYELNEGYEFYIEDNKFIFYIRYNTVYNKFIFNFDYIDDINFKHVYFEIMSVFDGSFKVLLYVNGIEIAYTKEDNGEFDSNQAYKHDKEVFYIGNNSNKNIKLNAILCDFIIPKFVTNQVGYEPIYTAKWLYNDGIGNNPIMSDNIFDYNLYLYHSFETTTPLLPSNASDFILTNCDITNEGIVGNCINIPNGSTSAVETGDAISSMYGLRIEYRDTFSLECWIYISSNPSSFIIANLPDVTSNATGRYIIHYLESSNENYLEFIIEDDDDYDNRLQLKFNYDFSFDEWHQIIFTYNNFIDNNNVFVSENCNFYIDSVKINLTEVVDNTYNATPYYYYDEKVYFGSIGTNINADYILFDELRVFNGYLTNDDVIKLYNNGTPLIYNN